MSFRISYGPGHCLRTAGRRIPKAIDPEEAQEWQLNDRVARYVTEAAKLYDGEEDVPIPYDENMQLESGKYYVQSDVIYLCIQDIETPVYHALADLIEIYMEVIL